MTNGTFPCHTKRNADSRIVTATAIDGTVTDLLATPRNRSGIIAKPKHAIPV